MQVKPLLEFANENDLEIYVGYKEIDYSKKVIDRNCEFAFMFTKWEQMEESLKANFLQQLQNYINNKAKEHNVKLKK